jgi:hypothetical protein
LICSSAEYVYLSIWLKPTSVSHSKLNLRDAAALIMPWNRLITIHSRLIWITYHGFCSCRSSCSLPQRLPSICHC